MRSPVPINKVLYSNTETHPSLTKQLMKAKTKTHFHKSANIAKKAKTSSSSICSKKKKTNKNTVPKPINEHRNNTPSILPKTNHVGCISNAKINNHAKRKSPTFLSITTTALNFNLSSSSDPNSNKPEPNSPLHSQPKIRKQDPQNP